MKIIVVHGDDTEKSYARLTVFVKEAKSRGWEIINDKIEETPSLFGTQKLIILRNYQLLDKKQLKLTEKIPGTLVIYHQKKLPQTFLKTLPPDTKKELFELPFLLWKFLDSMNIKTFQEVIETQPVEMVFAMIAKRLRDLYWVKTGSPKMSPWQLSKLKKQSDKYNKEKLEEIISDLAKIDIDAKTGKRDLKSCLDLLVIKKLS